MPEPDGIETCQRLKNNLTTKDIPIIFLTAMDRINDMVKGFQAGAVDYITKPFNICKNQRNQASSKTNG